MNLTVWTQKVLDEHPYERLTALTAVINVVVMKNYLICSYKTQMHQMLIQFLCHLILISFLVSERTIAKHYHSESLARKTQS